MCELRVADIGCRVQSYHQSKESATDVQMQLQTFRVISYYIGTLWEIAKTDSSCLNHNAVITNLA